eukprot:TRINITY_DN4092_c0_g1_i1.p1 TRINITY_DN4092_c0_g1~~TRINITY_DN4092_c0_g1_i1.p1  ORF type:complete len:217 (-),score=47.81 TRINITY_DN4092_c0_g1_i1:346-996(-)
MRIPLARIRILFLDKTVAIPLLCLFIVFLCGSTGFHVLEGWSYLDSVYFSIVTLTTLGYGDFTPTEDRSRMLFYLYTPLGLACMGYILATMSQAVIRKTEVQARTFLAIGQTMTDRLFPIQWRNKSLHKLERIAYRYIDRNIQFIILFVLINLMLFFGSALFSEIEDWSYSEAFYFCFTTVMKIGRICTSSSRPCFVSHDIAQDMGISPPRRRWAG